MGRAESGATAPTNSTPGKAERAYGESAAQDTGPILLVDNIAVHFGGIAALDGVTFALARGTILGLIGPNGAGKTTLFNCLSRLYTPDDGDIRFNGASILRMPAHRIARLGITRTFQNIALFNTLSVLDNVRLGIHARTRGNVLSDALRLPATRRREQASSEEAIALLDELGLAQDAPRRVADLPVGTRKRVEIARALAGRPQLLLLDEPAGGLNHNDVAELGDLIRHIRDAHQVTVLLVEHHMNLVMSVSDRVVALDFGRKIAEGTPEEVRADREVIRAYLGSAPQ